MQMPRKAVAYYDWMYRKLIEIEHCDFSLKKGLYKQFTEESVPLAYFAQYYLKNRQDIYIKHCFFDSKRQGKTNSYDAEMVDKEGNLSFAIHYLEITYPIDGLNIGHDSSLSYEKIKRILEKIEEKKLIHYPPKTALIVYTGDKDAHEVEIFKAKMSQNLEHNIGNFEFIFFVDKLEENCFQFPSDKKLVL